MSLKNNYYNISDNYSNRMSKAFLKINNLRVYKRDIVNLFKSIKYLYIKNIHKKTYSELLDILLNNLKSIKVPDLIKFLSNYDVKYLRKKNKSQLIDLIKENILERNERITKRLLKVNKFGLDEKIIKKLKDKKKILKNETEDFITINQEQINDYKLKDNDVETLNDIRIGLSEDKQSYFYKDAKKKFKYLSKELKEISYVDINFDKILKYNYEAKEKIIDEKDEKDINFTSTKVLVVYLISVDKDNKRDNEETNKKSTLFIKYFDFKIKDDKIIITFENENSEAFPYVIIGFRDYTILKKDKLNENIIDKLKAFSPCSDLKYNSLISVSTEINSKYCIFSSFLYLIKERELKYVRNKNNKIDELEKRLSMESEEIISNIKNGNLVESLKLLTKKYDCDLLVINYNKNIKNFEISKGEIKYEYDINNFKNNNILLYDFIGQHISPISYKKALELIKKNEEPEKNSDKNNKFVLRPINIKNEKTEKISIFGYDCETFLNSEKKCVVFCITLLGYNYKDERIEKVFYGLDCLDKFVSYIDEISDKTNYQKTKAKTIQEKIYIYGFNNASFDNLLIYKKLHEINKRTKIIFAKNSIPSMKFNNIRIFDISRFYRNGGLRETCKDFKLEKEKGVYPYTFVNESNLFYIGDIPEIKYWNSEKDYNEYKSKHTNFNMYDYTVKYCLLDSELVYELAKIHKNLCIGLIKNKKYNVLDCSTGAKLAIRIYQQIFLNENITESPKNIIQKERLAYKGGRTEKFKNHFYPENESDRLYYNDINSSYPFAMTYMMPYKYLKTMKMNKKITKENVDLLKEYYLYKVSFKYVGNDPNFIPNLMVRNDKTKEIIPVKECENEQYFWGIELIEAIKNNYEIYVDECDIYEGKAIFKEYAEYFYEERLEAKKNKNIALAAFYKLLLNSHYGKYGQKKFNQSKLCRKNEINFIIENNKAILKDICEIDDEHVIISFETEKDDNHIGNLCRFASYITSIARSRLSEFMRLCGHENVYYCDTDSVFTKRRITDQNIIDSQKLGFWKEETQTPIIKACFVAPKVYTYITENFEKCVKSKGVDSKKIDSTELFDLVQNKKENIEQNKKMFFRSFKGIKIDDQMRTLTIVNNKRLFNGNDSSAYKNIEEWFINKKKWLKERFDKK